MITQTRFEYQFTLASHYVFNYFAPRLHKSELLIVWAVLNATLGSQRDTAMISFSRFAELTDLSKQSISDGIQAALARGLIGREPYGNTYIYWFIGDENEYRDVDDLNATASSRAPNSASRPAMTSSPENRRSTHQTAPVDKRSTHKIDLVDKRSSEQIHTVDKRSSEQTDSKNVKFDGVTSDHEIVDNSTSATTPQSTEKADLGHLSTTSNNSSEETVYSVDTKEVSRSSHSSSEENLLYNDLLKVLHSADKENRRGGGSGFYNIYSLARKLMRLEWSAGELVELWTQCIRCGVGVGYFVKAALREVPPPVDRPTPEECTKADYQWDASDYREARGIVDSPTLGAKSSGFKLADKHRKHIESVGRDVIIADGMARGVIDSPYWFSMSDELRKSYEERAAKGLGPKP